MQQLINKSKKEIRQTGLPLISVTSDQQVGNTFGERFANAIETVFNAGYTSVIAVGNDSPQLDSHIILEASQSLQQNNIVLGPAEDGGIYLLGLKRENYLKESFLQLSWESPGLQEDFRAYCESFHLKTTWLKVLVDIDHRSAVVKILNLLPGWNEIKGACFAFLQQVKNNLFDRINAPILPFIYRHRQQRAPPQLNCLRKNFDFLPIVRLK